MAKKQAKPAEFKYVLKYVHAFDPMQFLGVLSSNPNYGNVEASPLKGYSVGDHSIGVHDKHQMPQHWAQMTKDIKEGNWTIPVSAAAFRGPDGSRAVYIISGKQIVGAHRELEKPVAIVVADHDGAFPDADEVSKPETSLPRGVASWYTAAGWHYASTLTALVIPERQSALWG